MKKLDEIPVKEMLASMLHRDLTALQSLVEGVRPYKKAKFETWSPLEYAVSIDWPEGVAFLLPFCDVNWQGVMEKKTALMLSLEGGLGEACFERLWPLSDVSLEDHRQETALFKAVSNGRLRAVKQLLPVSNAFKKNKDGFTVFDLAIQGHQHEILAHLMDQLATQCDEPWIQGLIDEARANDHSEGLDILRAHQEKRLLEAARGGVGASTLCHGLRLKI